MNLKAEQGRSGASRPVGRFLLVMSTLALSPIFGTTTAEAVVQPYSEGNAWYVPYGPLRALDTRVQTSQRGSWTTLVNLPTSAPYQNISGWVANVTITNATTDGAAVVWGAAEASMNNIAGPPPNTSSLNWRAGETVAAVVPVFSPAIATSGGHMAIQTLSAGMRNVDWVVDLVGYFAFQPATGNGLGRFSALSPVRIADTRQSQAVPAGGDFDFTLAGQKGIPASSVEVAVLNVTVVGGAASGWLSVERPDQPSPGTSNLNWLPGEIRANAAYAPLSPNGHVRLHNGSGSPIDIVVDATGYFTDASAPVSQGLLLQPVSPTRLSDTRASATPLVAGESRIYPLATRAGIPATVGAALASFTVANTTSAGYLELWPSAPCTSKPLASHLNWPGDDIRANLATIGLSAGNICLFNQTGSTDFIVDMFGYFQ